MYCTECGEKKLELAKFCTTCGTAQAIEITESNKIPLTAAGLDNSKETSTERRRKFELVGRILGSQFSKISKARPLLKVFALFAIVAALAVANIVFQRKETREASNQTQSAKNNELTDGNKTVANAATREEKQQPPIQNLGRSDAPLLDLMKKSELHYGQAKFKDIIKSKLTMENYAICMPLVLAFVASEFKGTRLSQETISVYGLLSGALTSWTKITSIPESAYNKLFEQYKNEALINQQAYVDANMNYCVKTGVNFLQQVQDCQARNFRDCN